MPPEIVVPRAASVTGSVAAGDTIKEVIKPGSGIPTTPLPPSYDQPQSDPGDEDPVPERQPIDREEPEQPIAPVSES